MLVTPITTIAPDGRNVGLVPGRVYEVLGIEGDYYRILTDGDHPHCPNDPLLYEPEIFRVIEESEPEFWVSEYDDGERYAYPEQWLRGYFFQDYHERVPETRLRFWADLERFFPMTWKRVRGYS